MIVKGEIGEEVSIKTKVKTIQISENRISYGVDIKGLGIPIYFDEKDVRFNDDEELAEDTNYCQNCRFKTVDAGKEPCNYCHNGNNWRVKDEELKKTEEVRKCGNCKFMNIELEENEAHCLECEHLSEWQLIEEKAEQIEQPAEKPAKRRGRPRKATVEDLMKKAEQMRGDEDDE